MKLLFKLDTKNHKWSQVCAIFIASLSGITSMAMMSWTSPSIPILTSNSSKIETITYEEASYFSVIPPTSAIIASPLMAILVDAIGRKKMIVLITIPHIISWGIILTAKNLTHLYISRIVYGIADAMIYCAVPVYIGEISTPNVRGTWGNLLMMFMFLGEFLINLVGAFCSIRTTALIFITIPIIQLMFTLFIPESPYFLIMKGQHLEAEKSLKLLRWNQNVQKEFESIKKAVQRQISEPGRFKHLLVIATNRKALFICIIMRIFQQLSGVNAFSVYIQQMFATAGGKLSSSISAIIYTGVLVTSAVSFLFVVHKFGRRQWMLFSTTGATIALFVEAVYFYLQFEAKMDMFTVNWIPLTAMVFYICTSVGGIRYLPTLTMAELFSSSIKGKAVGVVNIVNFLSILAVPKLFQYLSVEFSLFVPFLLFSVCTLVSIAFYYIFLPETKGKTLEEIQQSLINKKVLS